jgi:glutamate-ammonia-ligase adenylyltransferase
VCGFEALEAYFVAQGREWERYAWIKARAVSGSAADRKALEEIVRPFVYRKYLDYATLEAMRRLHAEVRRDVARRELAEHVKLGPGGIREIEFIAQALQLVRGGRDADLTARPTLLILDLLHRRRLLPENAAAELAEAYVFLRNIEHRLQYLDDAQTHELPTDAGDRARVSGMAGFASWADFHAALNTHRDAVTRNFQTVFAQPGAESEPGPWPDHPRLAALRAGQRYLQLPDDSRRRFDVLIPALAGAAAATPDPEATLARGTDLLEAIARRAAYLALLAERPDALQRVTRMIGASSWAAQYVTQHPLLLDELLDDRVLYSPPDWPEFEHALRAALAAAGGDLEREMNAVRDQHHSQLFRLLAQDLAGLLTVEVLADHLSQLADIVLQASLEFCWAQLPTRHREQPRFAVIAYGKLGGKELGYASDLDMVFLFDDADQGEGAEHNYLRFAQRYNNWLSANTPSGTLFETDLALRPSGSKGLLVSSLSGFDEYQEHSAWVWEHQALTRARFCAGDRDVGNSFELIRMKILERERDPKALARQVLGMREKIHAAHPNTSGLFDLKHDRGGMIDIEFTVQFLVLAHARRHRELTQNLGNIALLGMAGELGLIPPALAEECGGAYRKFRRLQHALRLNGAQYARVPQEQVAAKSEAVRELWRAVFSAHQ